jgi:hypothetical protein
MIGYTMRMWETKVPSSSIAVSVVRPKSISTWQQSHKKVKKESIAIGYIYII